MPRKSYATKKSYIEQWRDGERNIVSPGNVVCLKTSPDTIAVVGSPCYDVDTYEMKVWTGPKPWDYHVMEINAHKVTVVDKPNPCKYNDYERYPGPSSASIKKSIESWADYQKNRLTNRTSKDVDREIAIIEEEMSKDRTIDDTIDKVVPEDDEDGIEPLPFDPLDAKRKVIIDGE